MANYIVPVLSEYEWQKGVINALNDPPISPSNGDRYIIASSPTGVWIGHANEIATYDNNIWTYLHPFQGMIIYVQFINRLLQFTTIWEALSAIGKEQVNPIASGLTLTPSQFGETIAINSVNIETIYLPSVNALHIGAWYRFVKLGSGTVIIEAADLDTIADSGAGDTIYNNTPGETYATLTLLLVSESKWVITEGHGTWTTTD